MIFHHRHGKVATEAETPFQRLKEQQYRVATGKSICLLPQNLPEKKKIPSGKILNMLFRKPPFTLQKKAVKLHSGKERFLKKVTGIILIWDAAARSARSRECRRKNNADKIGVKPSFLHHVPEKFSSEKVR